MSKLGQIFSSGVVNKIEVVYDDVQNSGILETVGTSAFPVKSLAVDASQPSLKVFGLTANLDAQSTAQASILAPTAEITPFDDTTPLTAPSGSSYAQLSIDGKLSGAISGSVSSLPLSVSGSGAASFTYDHWIPAASTEQRLAALTRLVTTAQLPQFENLPGLAAGEISRFEAKLNVDLGIQAKYGSSFDLSKAVSLFDGLSAQLKASVQYEIEASLGWSMYEDMDVAVGKAQQKNPGWVRVRIDRAHGSTFTAGATFALNVAYDVSSIGDALEKAFQMTPLPRAISILTTVSQGNWDAIKTQISDRAANDLISLIAGTGWKEKAANSPDVQKALAAINKVVSIYKNADAKVQQLWAGLLVKADLQPGSPLRTTIEKIAAIDPQNPDLQQFLSPAAQKDLEMLESLTGKSIEELLVGSNTTVQIALTRAVKLAKQLENVITDTPAEITSALSTFAKDHGIQSAIAFLAANATSLDQIQAFGDSAINKLVAKAVGKAFDAINPQDLAKVQAWAQKIVGQWNDLSAKLAAAAKFLKGTLGFNASLEISRASEYSAVLDFEIDPANAAAVAAARDNLPSGDVQKMLQALAAIDANAFTIRQSVIISRHLRTGVTTVLLSILGLSNLQKISGTRFTETSMQIGDSGRTASYSGGFTQSVTSGNTTSQCSVWIAAEASDGSLDPAAPFAAVTREMRLTFSRNDTKTSAEELQALQKLLVDLGFFATGGEPVTDAAAGVDSAFTIDITLDDAALQAFAQDDGEANWNDDFRNAGYRLLGDHMVTDQLTGVGEETGQVLAAVVKTDLFNDTWTDTSTTKFRQDPRVEMLSINDKPLNVLDDQLRFVPPYLTIQMLITRRPRGFAVLDELRNAVAHTGAWTPGDLSALAGAGENLFGNTQLPEWDNPMFAFWFVVARLCRLGNGNSLATAKGLATFRFRAQPTDAYSAPMQQSLTANVGVPAAQIKARQLFPFA
jgi:hypothetical protein